MRDTQWWLTEHLVPGGLGRGTGDLGGQQKDGQGLMDGQDFAAKCRLRKTLPKTGEKCSATRYTCPALMVPLNFSELCGWLTLEWGPPLEWGPMLLEFMGAKSFLFSSTKVHGFYQSFSFQAQCSKARAMVKVTQLCITLCDPMDYTVHRILRPECWSG